MIRAKGFYLQHHCSLPKILPVLYQMM